MERVSPSTWRQPLAKKDRLEELYEENAVAILRLAYLLVSDREVAEELTQEAFIRSFSRFSDLRSEQAFGFYLRRTVVNLSRNHYRRSALERRYAASNPLPYLQRPPEIEEREALLGAVRRLPIRQKTVVVLRYFEDLSEAQTAELMDTSVAAVKSMLQRALRTLREEEME